MAAESKDPIRATDLGRPSTSTVPTPAVVKWILLPLPVELDHLRVVLVDTRNPLNLGAAARAMSNFGFLRLRVVNPYDVAFREARSAMGAAELLASAEEYKRLAEAVAWGCILWLFGHAGVRVSSRLPLVGRPVFLCYRDAARLSWAHGIHRRRGVGGSERGRRHRFAFRRVSHRSDCRARQQRRSGVESAEEKDATRRSLPGDEAAQSLREAV